MLPRLALLTALALASSACAGGYTPLATTPSPSVSSRAADPLGDLAGNGDLSALERNVDEGISGASLMDGDGLSSDEVVRDVERALGLRSSATAEGEAPSWDIAVEPYAENESVERYVKLFGGSRREYFATRLQRGSRYEPMIRGKLRAAGLPEDLFYLALVESGYDPHAYSRAAAVGMWQFMTTTARGVGLRVDWWVDERRDPVRATDAAVKYLGWLQREFGSLYLAAAAYNGGSGRVSRGLAKHADDVAAAAGEDRFFALAETGYLRAETENYVPQLIAAALVAKEPARYQISYEPLPPLAYDSVLVPAATPLAAVAAAAEVPLADVRDLNGHFLRGVTPPGDSSWVRVPALRAIGFGDRFAALPAEARAAFAPVESDKGESLAAIARRHGRSERELSWYNPGLKRLKSGKLQGGQTVLVPTAAAVAAALDVPDPAVERYGTGSTPTRAPRVHVVAKGDNLERIARRYSTSVSRLRAANRLESDRIRIGQRLLVDGAAKSSAKVSSSARGAAKKATKKGTTKRSAAKSKTAKTASK